MDISKFLAKRRNNISLVDPPTNLTRRRFLTFATHETRLGRRVLWKFVKYYRIWSSSWREFYTENGLKAQDEILFFKDAPHQTPDGINRYFVRFNKRIAAAASGGTQG